MALRGVRSCSNPAKQTRPGLPWKWHAYSQANPELNPFTSQQVQEKLSVYGVRTLFMRNTNFIVTEQGGGREKKKCQVLTEEKLAGTGTRLDHSP
jgi:hypothetical protein